jgi:hypothetical protein
MAQPLNENPKLVTDDNAMLKAAVCFIAATAVQNATIKAREQRKRSRNGGVNW